MTGLLYASSTPLLGDAARRRRRSWPVRATNVFFPIVIDFYAAPAKTVRPDAVAGGWPVAWTYAWTHAERRRPGLRLARRRPTAGPTQGWDRSPTD